MTTSYLLEKQLDRVLAALTPSNELVCRVCLHTGLRVSDVLNLRTEDIKPRFWVTEMKTKKRKQVGLPAKLRADILAQAGPEWAFPGRKPGAHRTRQAVWVDLHRAAKAFRLHQVVGAHSMRKIYAVRLMNKYGDLSKVCRALNHSDMTVTLLYAMADKLMEEKPMRPRRQA